MASTYCASRFHSIRRKSRIVSIGNIQTGGTHPVRIQSMTTTDTMDVDATVRQTIELAEAGCEIVRITAPNVRAAEALGLIAKEVRSAGFHIPLVADIHFLPKKCASIPGTMPTAKNSTFVNTVILNTNRNSNGSTSHSPLSCSAVKNSGDA